MKLATLLHKHIEHPASEGLTQNLGDCFLLEHNRIYRQVRHKALDLGFSYSTQMSEDFIAFPLGQLENILAQKVIPYVNNVTPLKNIDQKTSSNLDWDHVVDNLKPNYVFHESCHAIARAFSSKMKATDLKARLTTTLIEESFANTCEFFAIAEANDQVHRTFLEVNSYFTVFEDRTHLKKILEQNDVASVFKFMLLCYLHSNFLNESFGEKDFKKIISLSGVTNKIEIKALKSIAANVFALNPRFRYTTSEMYLRLNGIRQQVEQALDFDYLQLISTDQNIKHFISELALFAAK